MNALANVRAGRADLSAGWFSRVIAAERDALSAFLAAPPEGVADVVALLAAQRQPVILTGIGKSAHVAAKLAATFSSLGTPALFVNAAEAAHGDLGAIAAGSTVIALSNSGSTDEILRILPLLRARSCTLVGIVGRRDTPLARAVDHLIPAEVAAEADHLGMAPTASTTLHLAIGDALAVAVSRTRGFTREDFLAHHPAGLLGRRAIPVRAIMRRGEDVPRVSPHTDLVDLLAIMSAKRMGAACVLGDDDLLTGIVVDGDVRRHLQAGPQVKGVKAADLMQTAPVTLPADATIGDALLMREGAQAGWLVLPVVDAAGRLEGMVHAHDLFG
ncbi:SIS domain-containing protein [Erythrobacter sp. HL-111]|uniref:KpsF/GutQ family sugar-phosphate isomerase n=1 Tax=Erythrobacter sp. HL-111 TaxID=1798193 RepID=UPI0006DBA478|nr:KpsF/GutQ family sugar-phosphate isomerase [Erythrobacter sp. HL-111]KPP88473.1 MAG: arabinose-5-phosphate isomerase [Erythrobacteraceae bacterium HL-111]SDS19437.1 arabinose-5-phosphate isomerase [Erythrobacter sp. HL-111]